ncbi:MAG: endonuclease [Eubacterium sp.]|jgi:5-methylcytosine-specific restriction protein A|nr:endonuclease [Eubacterium sp.]
MKLKRTTGKLLNEKWNVNAKHALYREDGKWYHHLTEFPGALFDKHGYILFNSKNEYISCNYLQHAKDLHCPSGISSINGYIKVID